MRSRPFFQMQIHMQVSAARVKILITNSCSACQNVLNNLRIYKKFFTAARTEKNGLERIYYVICYSSPINPEFHTQAQLVYRWVVPLTPLFSWSTVSNTFQKSKRSPTELLSVFISSAVLFIISVTTLKITRFGTNVVSLLFIIFSHWTSL